MTQKAKERESVDKLMETDAFKNLFNLFYSTEFGHIDGSEWSMNDSSLLLLWNFFLTNNIEAEDLRKLNKEK